MVQRAERVQVHNGTLTFYDGTDEVLGVYERAWQEVAAADVLGSWVPVSLFGAQLDLERVDHRDLPLLRFSALGFSAHDGLNETSRSYKVGKRGEFRYGGPHHDNGGLPGRADGKPGGQPLRDRTQPRGPRQDKAACR